MFRKVKLGEISTIQYGFTAKSSPDVGNYKYLRITDIQDGIVNWNLVPFCEVPEEKVDKFLLMDGDIVFARTGATTGKSFLLKDPRNAVFASYLIRTSVDREVVSPLFISYFFQSKEYWNQINSGISGAAQGGFNANKLSELKVPLPSLQEQEKLTTKIQVAFQKINSALKLTQQKSNELQLLKDSLINQELIKHS